MRVKIIVLFVLIVLLLAYVFLFGLGYASPTVKNLARLVTLQSPAGCYP